MERKEAIEIIRKLYNESLFLKKDKEAMVTLIPELAESENERIINNIRKVIGWYRGMFTEKSLMPEQYQEIDAWLEMRGEQKPVDKVEPKFHEGEWIVRELDNTCYQIKKCILNVTDNKYGYDLTNGGYISSLDANFYHLWTIEDAKDSHVLAYNDGSLTIFRYRLSGLDAGLYMAHVLLTDKIEFKQTCAIADVHPATKEQHDTLMKAMTDAGYTFDFKKKELKKIEQKPWSEEDERDFDVIYGIIYNSCNAEDASRLIEWLKSLKDRVQSQPQQQWSEEDETRLTNIIIMLKEGASYHFIKDDITKAVDWLKSLKQRIRG
jgi:hypothetical protein